MLQLDDQSKIVFFHRPVNLHKRFDALAHLVQTELSLKLIPNLFVLFCNRRKNQIKILYHNGKNLLLLSTRFEKTLNFKYQEGVIFDRVSFDEFLNRTISRQHLSQFKSFEIC
mgnify:CR=1 FL=1